MESHQKKYSKAPDEIWLSWLSCVVLAKRNSQGVDLLTLLITIDSVSDVSRVTRGLAIRRAKKSVNLTNDKRMKICSQRFDSHAYTRLQFLRAVSDAVGSEKMLSESHSDADDDDDTEVPDNNTQHQNDDVTSDDAAMPTTVSADAAVDFCEVDAGAVR